MYICIYIYVYIYIDTRLLGMRAPSRSHMSRSMYKY